MEMRLIYPRAQQELDDFRSTSAAVGRLSTLEAFPLHRAAWLGQFLLVQKHLRDGINVDSTLPRSKITGLLYAVDTSQFAVVQLLLSRGASVNKASAGQSTALHILAQKREGKDLQVAIAKALVDAGADRTAKRKEGLTPYWYLITFCANKASEEHRLLFHPGDW
ncbi:ankyrin [Mytilinidion resinicola]|uniref:Ankyrin n=1 Tax=Mytilinidion resinicola TaxID=574789 RepID=A0A6A6ZA71_9PEZI|nr:ankyrin [Mytilinidion resinicola]KAF2817728.1 ankyrin [Mytilinidion resinicola]